MIERILKKAHHWGFVTKLEESWQIYPVTGRWRLQQVDDRWLLILEDLPQLYMSQEAVIPFLERRYQRQQKSFK